MAEGEAMSPAPARFVELARLLLAQQLPGSAPDAIAIAGERIYERLFGRLAPLIGAIGFDALLGRTLHVAKAEFPILERVKVAPALEGRLDGLREAMRGRPTEESRDAVVALVAGFLGRLGYFIGDDLTLREVHRAWPGLPQGGASAAPRERTE